MKKRILPVLALALLLTGCSVFDGSYVSVNPHVVAPATEGGDATAVSDYPQLRNALTDLVDSGGTEALFSLDGYLPEVLDSDLDLVKDYILNDYPIGAYAVENLEFEKGAENRLSAEITYRHTRTEIQRIETVRGASGAQAAIGLALGNCETGLTLLVTSYEDTDFPLLAEEYGELHPDVVMELPLITCRVYPDKGQTRVVELVFSYQTNRESLRNMRKAVEPIFSSARLYVTENAEDEVKLTQLYNFLTERFDYTFETSITPAYSLLCHGVGDSRAFAQVYAAMCRQVGLECTVVSGTRSGESRFWNIVRNGETYYHVDLLRSLHDGGYAQYGDDEMSGYVWDYSAYPVCGAPETEE